MPDNGAVVYVAQEPHLKVFKGALVSNDLSSAAEFGSVQLLADREQTASLAPAYVLFKIKHMLKNFDASKDFICFAGGDPLNLSMALMVLKDMGFGEVKMLRWDRKISADGRRMHGGYYTPITVPLQTGE